MMASSVIEALAPIYLKRTKISLMLCLAAVIVASVLYSRQVILSINPSSSSHLLTFHIEDITSKQLRMKQRVREVCQRIRAGYYVTGPTAEASVSKLKAKVDHYHQVVYCKISKAGSTSWLNFFKILFRRESDARKQWFNASRLPSLQQYDKYERHLNVGVSQLSTGAVAHLEDGEGFLIDQHKNYFKYMIARHPLERLGSAFTYFRSNHVLRRPIAKKMLLRRSHKATWMRNPDRQAGFTEFLHYVARPDVDLSGPDNHFLGFQSNCEPCDIEYNYMGHLETLSEDLPYILKHLNATDLVDTFPTANRQDKGNSKYQQLFLKAPFSALKPVLEKYRADADMFGYDFSAYVRESDKHKLPWLN